MPVIPTVQATRPLQRSRKHPYAYYNQFKPLLIILQLFGRYSLQVTRQGEYRSSWLSLSMLYCLVMYSLQTYLAVIVCFRRVQALIDSQSDYDEFIFSIHVLAYLNIHFHVPFTYWLEGHKIARYLKKWATFQDNWKTTFGRSLRFNYQRHVQVYVGILIPSVLLFLVFEQHAVLHDPLHYFIPYFFSITSSALILGLWFFTCLEIKQLTCGLNTILLEKLHSQPNPWLLSRWRLLWLDLRSLTESLGTDLCAVLMSITLTFSITFLLGMYNGLVQLITNSVSFKVPGYISAASFSLALIYVFCDGGHRATNGVVSGTLSALLKKKLTMFNPEIRHEIFLLLEAIKADPPEIKLGGFVTLNRPMVVSLISNTITYLIVLLQFKVNGEEQDPQKTM